MYTATSLQTDCIKRKQFLVNQTQPLLIKSFLKGPKKVFIYFSIYVFDMQKHTEFNMVIIRLTAVPLMLMITSLNP